MIGIGLCFFAGPIYFTEFGSTLQRKITIHSSNESCKAVTGERVVVLSDFFYSNALKNQYTYVMRYRLKQSPSDFIVSEHLGFSLSEEGEYFWIYFEKEDKNTMDIVHHICAGYDCSRKDIGIAGLKDKKAVTTQRLSIHKDIIMNDTEKFLHYCSSVCAIKATGWHDVPLTIGMHARNDFSVRIQGICKVFDTEKERIDACLEKITTHGFPNYFGQQRFGKGMRNYERACAILERFLDDGEDIYEQRFALQSRPAYWFNMYVEERWKKEQWLLEGDILVDSFDRRGAKVGYETAGSVALVNYAAIKEQHRDVIRIDTMLAEDLINKGTDERRPTGPLLGWNSVLSRNISGTGEYVLYEKSGCARYASGLKNYHIWGRRRPLRCKPEQLNWTWQGNDCIVEFSLPVGSYATVLIETAFASKST